MTDVSEFFRESRIARKTGLRASPKCAVWSRAARRARPPALSERERTVRLYELLRLAVRRG